MEMAGVSKNTQNMEIVRVPVSHRVRAIEYLKMWHLMRIFIVQAVYHQVRTSGHKYFMML